MTPNRSLNRKLLVSVFNAQEAREAVLGGGRIIDSEDPKSALGNIKPQHIMAISDAVLDYARDLDVQLSTNIGEDQLLFRRSETGEALEKSPYEIAGKAAQAAIGVAASMGTRVHSCNLVKVGVDGMHIEMLKEVLAEVVLTLRRTEHFSHSQVMSVLFAQNVALWEERRTEESVRRVLVELREFYPSTPEDPLAFDLERYAVGTLRDREGGILFTDPGQVSLGSLVGRGVLPQGANHAFVRVNELFPHSQYFPRLAQGKKTNRAVVKAMVDAAADSGANAIMLDTSILSKVSSICLVDTAGSDMVDFNRFGGRDLPQSGILDLEDIRFFVEYCHYRGIVANVAGSVESYQAQQLWVMVPELDQISTRGAASAVVRDPSRTDAADEDTRQHRIIRRTLVRGLAPPEHGGVLNIPARLKDDPAAQGAIRDLRERVAEGRRALGLPALETYFVDRNGNAEPAA
ncbi:MAG TPA: (5-formylfuran-3-yl)methyl phosphate synthase [Longimicrobium sp.]|jgi:uncharacterized protein (UPF0264 family)